MHFELASTCNLLLVITYQVLKFLMPTLLLVIDCQVLKLLMPNLLLVIDCQVLKLLMPYLLLVIAYQVLEWFMAQLPLQAKTSLKTARISITVLFNFEANSNGLLNIVPSTVHEKQ